MFRRLTVIAMFLFVGLMAGAAPTAIWTSTDRVLVDAERAAKDLQITYTRNDADSTVTFAEGEKTLTLTLKAIVGTLTADHLPRPVETLPPMAIYEGRVYVPARAVAEAYGGEVGYDAQAHCIIVKTFDGRQCSWLIDGVEADYNIKVYRFNPAGYNPALGHTAQYYRDLASQGSATPRDAFLEKLTDDDMNNAWGNPTDEGFQAYKHVAVLIHGFSALTPGKCRKDLITLAAHLVGTVAGRPAYDAVFVVEYPMGDVIDDTGAAVAQMINKRCAGCPPGYTVDIFAHCMGGLVARSAIGGMFRNVQRPGTGARVARLVMMATPNGGIPADVIKGYGNVIGLFINPALPQGTVASGAELLLPELSDVTTGSDFLTKLDARPSAPSRYYSVVGTCSYIPTDYLFGFKGSNELIHVGGKVHDGLVTEESAGRDLSGRCIAWDHIEFSVNHDYVHAYQSVMDAIDGWLARATGGNVIPAGTNPKDGAAMVWVPGGSFTMGTPYGNNWNTAPLTQQVTLSGYWIYTYDVTVAQYRVFCAAMGRVLPPWPGDEYSWAGKTSWADATLQQHPIVNVTWDDATAYAAWAGGSLPTEAQWEYAAAGPTGRNYPWGGTATAADPDNGWDKTKCANAYNSADVGVSTWPVGSFPAGVSWCGAQDMSGEVWQWCADWYAPYSATPVTNPTGPATGTWVVARVLRGGSWYNDGAPNPNIYFDVLYRCAHRDFGPVQVNWYGGKGVVGLRCVSVSPGP